jgi:hypothetical protein
MIATSEADLPTRSRAKSTPEPIISVSLELTTMSFATPAEQPSSWIALKVFGLKPPSGTLRYLERAK